MRSVYPLLFIGRCASLAKPGLPHGFYRSPGYTLRELRQRGITLVEAVLYLLVALTLLVGGIIYFQRAELSNRVNDTTRVVVAMQSELRGIFSSFNDFGTADILPVVLSSEAIPATFLTDTDNDGTADDLVHAWGGDIDITGAGDQFEIQFSGLPSAACTRMISYETNGQGASGVDIASVEVGGTDADGDADGAVTPIEASTACGIADEVDVVWTFDR